VRQQGGARPRRSALPRLLEIGNRRANFLLVLGPSPSTGGSICPRRKPSSERSRTSAKARRRVPRPASSCARRSSTSGKASTGHVRPSRQSRSDCRRHDGRASNCRRPRKDRHRRRRGAARRAPIGRAGASPSRTRSRAIQQALKHEGHSAASKTALARHARAAAAERTASDRSASARKAAKTKGAEGRSAAARKAARTRERTGR